MGSKREEERNEKIIRGLMKLPPNRRCINCNSLGPQYVCTNFWTFVCMTCSGIHREFTHRVKSVSMSKFTSQEVEALQNSGNQRAREIYLTDWDQQRQRLPHNSNVDKVREFIKYVYVDRKYAGGKTADKPPRDLQRLGSHEDEIRRASSYHSYSQSPPYDFQYEDRRYGKQAPILTRKPGSDRGLYPGKVSSFISSPPASLNERALEDRFANEGSDSRISDYSLSSGGDQVRSGTESPNFPKESGFSSPPVQPSSSENAPHQKINLFSEANFKSNSDGVPRPQRSTSLGSIGSFDSNLISLKSNYSGSSIIDIVSGPDQAAQLPQDTVSGFPQASTADPDSSNLFKAPTLLGASASVKSDIDLFQFSASSPTMSVDLFQVSPSNPAPAMNFNQSSQTSPHLSLDLFGESAQQQPVIAVDKRSTEALVSKDEGWATFDIPQHSLSSLGTENLTASSMRSGVGSVKFDQVSSLNTSTQCPEFQNSGSQVSSSISSSDLWHGNFHNIQANANATDGQTWNAFDGSITQPHAEGIKQISELQLKSHEPLSSADLYLGFGVSEGSGKDGIQKDASHVGFPGPSNASDFVTGSSYTLLPHTLMEEMQTRSHPSDGRSTNPFDLPYESDLEPSNTFLDVSSLQGALPKVPPSFIGATHQQWFFEDPLGAYLPAAPQGGLSYMPAQAPNPRLANLQTQEAVASVGGNPFA